MRKKHKKIALAILITILSTVLQCSGQTTSLEFHWTNPNTTPVTFDVLEVGAPPDTNQVFWKINKTPITCSTIECTWIVKYTPDDSTHFFRMRAVKNDTIFSTLSNTASIYIPALPMPPADFRIEVLLEGEKK